MPQYQGCPSGLVAGAETFSGVTMKVFVEEHELAPVRIGVKTSIAAVTGPHTVRTRQEKSGQARGDLSRTVLKINEPA